MSKKTQVLRRKPLTSTEDIQNQIHVVVDEVNASFFIFQIRVCFTVVICLRFKAFPLVYPLFKRAVILVILALIYILLFQPGLSCYHHLLTEFELLSLNSATEKAYYSLKSAQASLFLHLHCC